MASNDLLDDAVSIQTERRANQALPSSTLVSQQGSAQAERVEITQVISTAGVSSITGTANQITASSSTGAVTVSLPTTITVTTAYQVGGTQVLSARKTGWGSPSGTLSRAAYAAYAGQTISDPPTFHEVQALDDAVKLLSQTVAALLTDLHSATSGHGAIGT